VALQDQMPTVLGMGLEAVVVEMGEVEEMVE